MQESDFYIVPTPIGNLEEVSSRAIKALQECQCILCEDTRVTSKLLAKLNIHNKELISYQKFNENEKVLNLQKFLAITNVLLTNIENNIANISNIYNTI